QLEPSLSPAASIPICALQRWSLILCAFSASFLPTPPSPSAISALTAITNSSASTPTNPSPSSAPLLLAPLRIQRQQAFPSTTLANPFPPARSTFPRAHPKPIPLSITPGPGSPSPPALTTLRKST